jgi:hypothetical protein
VSCIIPLEVSLHPAFLCPIHFAILLMQVDEKQKSVLLSEVGYEAAEEILGVTDLYDPREQWASYLINAIKAKEIFLKNCQLCGWPEGSHHRSNQQADDYLEGTHSCLAS